MSNLLKKNAQLSKMNVQLNMMNINRILSIKEANIGDQPWVLQITVMDSLLIEAKQRDY